MQYIAHKDSDGTTQSVKEHLSGTADLAKSFAVNAFSNLAYNAGLLHDLGKYSSKFQRRINGEDIRVEHAISGAKEVELLYDKNKFFKQMLKSCIAGHHSGLPDGGSDVDLPEKATLSGRMKRKAEDFSAYKEEIQPKDLNTDEVMTYFNNCLKTRNLKEATELYAFMTKYLYSCLVDADFIDTEKFFEPNVQRGMKGDFKEALNLLNERLAKFSQDNEVRKGRSELQKQALENSYKSGDISILNMPTGSGKTLCSLKIALEQAIRENKKRIIYIIPYTSIIEQTAETFEGIFGKVLPVLQHHSNYSFEKEESENTGTAEKLKRTCENWDSKLIISTSVQFFQSIYHYRSSRLRKLHNLADSIIIFDEIHMIPIEHLQPCLRAIGYITRILNSKAIFLSATMPDYSSLFNKFLPENKISQLISDKQGFSVFNNCKYINLNKTDFESIVQKSCEYRSSLIIVNSRKSAQQVYDMLDGNKFHLSTYMTPKHRSKVIAEIKRNLDNKEKITVVSTSLVEAGVDFDFQVVFRQIAGLDSILQAGGRCNREGEEDEGFVFIFETIDKPRGDVLIRADITKNIIDKYEDISSAESIEDYYGRLFSFRQDVIDKNSISGYLGNNTPIMSIPFKSYAESFEYIKFDTIGIIINQDQKSAELLEKLKWGDKSVLKKLQGYTVSVYFYEFEEIKKMGVLSEIGGVFVLENNKYYNQQKGLAFRENFDEDYMT